MPQFGGVFFETIYRFSCRKGAMPGLLCYRGCPGYTPHSIQDIGFGGPLRQSSQSTTCWMKLPSPSISFDPQPSFEGLVYPGSSTVWWVPGLRYFVTPQNAPHTLYILKPCMMPHKPFANPIYQGFALFRLYTAAMAKSGYFQIILFGRMATCHAM